MLYNNYKGRYLIMNENKTEKLETKKELTEENLDKISGGIKDGWKCNDCGKTFYCPPFNYRCDECGGYVGTN